jgi:hypothetical protein
MTRIEIDRLVLTGWPLGSREASLVQAAVEMELGRLFETGPTGAGPTGGAIDRLVAEPVTWTAGGDPSVLGRQVAQSVYGSVGQ